MAHSDNKQKLKDTCNSDDQSRDKKASSAPDPMTYNSYLKINEIKQLQSCKSTHHDETLFIIIHQAYELWFKEILHEIDEVFVLLEQDKIRRATFFLRRIVAIFKLLVQQIHLLETMTPLGYLGFRDSLTSASGFGSSQFREIEFAAGAKYGALLDHFRNDPAYDTLKRRFESPSLGEAFYAVLRQKGFKLVEGKDSMSEEKFAQLQEARIRELLPIYLDDDKYGDLHDLAECLVEIDEYIFLWRAHHVTVVERIIGFKKGTGSSDGVAYLQTTLTKRCFPDLWKLRTFLEHPDKVPSKEPVAASGAGGCPFHSS